MMYLIDGSGIFHRAYHAYPKMEGPDGRPTNAIFGTTEILWNLLDKFKKDATHIAVIFDHPGPNFRHNLYPEYKANRKKKEDDLVAQYEGGREAARAFNLPCVEMEGYECDDLIATYADYASEADIKCTVISSDKDFCQLVWNGLDIYCPMKNETIGVHGVFEKFGVSPWQVVDVQALAGDPVDNVPGVPSIGIKTAAKLIQTYGTLEFTLSRANDVERPKTRQALIEHRESAILSKKLVTLDRNVPVSVPMEELVVREPDPVMLYEFLTKMDFQILLKRMEKEAFS